MTLVNILGEISFLDECILKLMNFKMFHIEKATDNLNKDFNFKVLNEQNPYTEPLNKIKKIFKILKISTPTNDLNAGEMKISNDDLKNDIYEEVLKMQEKDEKINNEITKCNQTLKRLGHIKNLEINLNEIFNSNQIVIRFGKLTIENAEKLKDLKNENYFFIPQDQDEKFCWGFLVYPKFKQEEFSKIIKDLSFSEYLISDQINTNPKMAIEEINSKIKELHNEKTNLDSLKKDFKNKYFNELKKIYCKFTILNNVFNYRKFAVSNEKQFYMSGFIPTRYIKKFNELFNMNKNVVFEFLKNKECLKYSPPVKLRTSRLFRPFEMYVTTYGTPSYESINPSGFIGLIYSLIFGIMFGDFGQGFLLLLGGFFAWKKSKSTLGLILTRCGFSSMIFGLIFDSLFGFEGLMSGFWEKLGVKFFPFHLLKPSNSIPILMVSCLLGMFLILISISINVFLNLKSKKFGEALFSHNGLAGLLCYGSCTVAVLFLILLKKNIFSPIFIVTAVIVPLILIFFSLPLGNIMNKNKETHHEKSEKFSISSSIFDMIDILLSYFTNTLSFLRIGGLALSHAALMLVVMKFAKMAGSLSFVGSVSGPIIIVLGNAFVIMLEGLIVSIQALRLIYYEIFSRFYQSNGTQFNPIKINYDK